MYSRIRCAQSRIIQYNTNTIKYKCSTIQIQYNTIHYNTSSVQGIWSVQIGQIKNRDHFLDEVFTLTDDGHPLFYS